MTDLLLLALIVAVAAVAVVLYLRSKRRQAGRPRSTVPVDPLRRDAAAGMDPRRIAPGDVVSYGGRDYVVRGTLQLTEGGTTWQEHLIDDVETRRWLTVVDDEELVITLYQRIRMPELQPGAPRIEHDGVTYVRDEHGFASYSATGTTGTGPTGKVEYYDYAVGDRRLSFERWSEGSDWEISVGEVVAPYVLDVYPSRDWR